MKHSRAAVLRRRRLVTSATVVVTLASAGAVLATQLPASSHEHSDHPAPHTTSSAFVGQRSLRQAVKAYLDHREGAITAAVYDNVAKRLIVINPTTRGRTASIVKVDILETLLHNTHGHLSTHQRRTAKAMIEHSDNDAATELWDEDGGASGVRSYNNDVGLKQTDPDDQHWGLTTTSAADQVTLVRALLRHSKLLTNRSRTFERRLMRHVEADQRWGISGGLPSEAKFGIKNGWLPVYEDHDRWEVNSMGWVRGDGKRYEIAVLTEHNDTEGYGIDTIEHIAAIAWHHVEVDKD
jgi:Beta-lactamase enzyme family